jgi:hypothetical protein
MIMRAIIIQEETFTCEFYPAMNFGQCVPKGSVSGTDYQSDFVFPKLRFDSYPAAKHSIYRASTNGFTITQTRKTTHVRAKSMGDASDKGFEKEKAVTRLSPPL